MKSIICSDLKKTYKIRVSKKGISGFLYPEYTLVEAIKNINFTVEEGSITGILGSNGAGKSTLIKMMTGILMPSEGSISVNGFTPSKREEKFKKSIGLMMGNRSSLIYDLPVRDSFEYLKIIYDVDSEKYKDALVLLKKINAIELLDIPVRKLSLGQRKKMELVSTILHNPKILFLDEATIGMDIQSKIEVLNFCMFLKRQYNTTIIYTSHDLNDVERICDKIIYLDKGEIIDVLNQYRAKKKYYRLKKGEIILMDQEQLEFLDDFIKDFNIKDSDLKKGNIKIPNFRAYQLNVLQNKYMDIEKNQDFNKLFEQKVIEIPSKYKKILREYQIVGVEWMLKLRAMNLGGILADDMGLGKTLQAISLISEIQLENEDLLGIIIVPTSLLHNWKEEFYKFSDIKPILVEGNAETRKELIEKTERGNAFEFKTGDGEFKASSGFTWLVTENVTIDANWDIMANLFESGKFKTKLKNSDNFWITVNKMLVHKVGFALSFKF